MSVLGAISYYAGKMQWSVPTSQHGCVHVMINTEVLVIKLCVHGQGQGQRKLHGPIRRIGLLTTRQTTVTGRY